MTQMNRFKCPSRLTQGGLTLVELIFVIVIVAILAAVAIPQFSGGTDDAKNAKASAIFESLKAAYAVQYAVRKRTPTIDEIVAGHDPGCPGTGQTRTCGNSAIVDFGDTPNAAVPASWTCKVSDISGTPPCY